MPKTNSKGGKVYNTLELYRKKAIYDVKTRSKRKVKTASLGEPLSSDSKGNDEFCKQSSMKVKLNATDRNNNAQFANILKGSKRKNEAADGSSDAAKKLKSKEVNEKQRGRRSLVGDEIDLSVNPSDDERTFPDEEDEDDEVVFPQPQTGRKRSGQQGVQNPAAGTIDYSLMQNDPAFQRMVSLAVEKRLNEEKEQREQRDQNNLPSTSNNSGNKTGNEPMEIDVLITPVRNDVNAKRSVLKSPSDTTIYAPGLMRNVAGRERGRNSEAHLNGDDMIEKISDFVERIRLDNAKRPEMEAGEFSGGAAGGAIPPAPNAGISSFDQARNVADNMIVEAEKYRATIEKPPGNQIFDQSQCHSQGMSRFVNQGNVDVNGRNSRVLANGAIDDEFFHITCHIEDSLKTKIEKGEYVELERLLPKDRSRKVSDENKMEMVFRDGATYFVQAQDRDSKINNVRK